MSGSGVVSNKPAIDLLAVKSLTTMSLRNPAQILRKLSTLDLVFPGETLIGVDVLYCVQLARGVKTEGDN